MSMKAINDDLDAQGFPVDVLVNSPTEINAKNGAIYAAAIRDSRTLRRGNFNTISGEDLRFLFDRYDSSFFDDRLDAMIRAAVAAPLRLRLSTRMTSSGGTMTTMTRRVDGKVVRYEIAIAADLLFRSFNDASEVVLPGRQLTDCGASGPGATLADASGTVVVNGILCTDRLQALQRIFEHELIHLTENLVWGDTTCRGLRFQDLARRVFGHQAFTHELPTRRDLARIEHGIQSGTRVTFLYQGTCLAGVVSRVTKRATVLVEADDGSLFNDGKRYKRYYVPVSQLTREDS
jgi:hypothetical protein